jgi:hypothetical protein
MQVQGAYGMQGQHPAGTPPAPLPPPLLLEGRYIDGPHSHVDKQFPFRPLEDESRATGRKSSAQADVQQSRGYGQPPFERPAPGFERSQTPGFDRSQAPGFDRNQAPAFGYPPPAPAYGPRPYERYNNNGPSFNGFRFPFNFR